MGYNSWQKLQLPHSSPHAMAYQHVKYWRGCGFPLTNNLQLDYQAKQLTHNLDMLLQMEIVQQLV